METSFLYFGTFGLKSQIGHTTSKLDLVSFQVNFERNQHVAFTIIVHQWAPLFGTAIIMLINCVIFG